MNQAVVMCPECGHEWTPTPSIVRLELDGRVLADAVLRNLRRKERRYPVQFGGRHERHDEEE